MKTMTCKQLAGACEVEFHAESFEEIEEMSKKHVMEMAGKGNVAHIEKMEDMKNNYMTKPKEVEAWFEEVKKSLKNYQKTSSLIGEEFYLFVA